MKNTFTVAEVIGRLQKQQKSMSLRQFAKVIGISAPYLSDIYNGNRHPGPKILRMLGLSRERAVSVTYFENGKPKK